MRRWIGVLLVPLVSGCIPIGIRGSNMPYASPARPLDHQRQISLATDEQDGNPQAQQSLSVPLSCSACPHAARKSSS